MKILLIAALGCCMGTVSAQDVSWISGVPRKSDWRLDQNWNAQVPTAVDHVLVNHADERGQTRVRVVPAEAASVRLGVGSGQIGNLAITQHGLLVDNVADDAASGRIIVGSQGGTGEITLRNASLTAGTAIVVADGAESSGTLTVDRNGQVACSVLQLGTTEDSTSTLVIEHDTATIDVGTMIVASNSATLRFGTARGYSPIRTLLTPTLAGNLEVDSRLLSRTDTEFILIDNQSADPIEGAFDAVHIQESRRGYFELTYSGGDGNDLALVRSDNPIRFEDWTAIHFAADDPAESTKPNADPDADGLSNIIEYKMGRSPVHAESAWMAGSQTTDEQTQLTVTTASYLERIDRDDVLLTLQGQLPGQHWQSSHFNQIATELSANIRRVNVTGMTLGVPEVRLFPQLLPNQSKPNVLFVMVDDLSDWLSCMDGHPQALTPNMDRLAERGTLFRQAHAAGTICGPSRVSILTGVAPSASGVYRNPQYFRENQRLQNAWTIPQYFRAKNYLTTGSGKIFHKQDPASWDEYWPSVQQYKPPQYFPPNRPLNTITTRGSAFDWGPIDQGVEVMSDYQIATWVGQRLQTLPQSDPFFLACGLFRPHLPFFAPQEYFDLFDPDTIELPPVLATDQDDLSPAAIGTVNEQDHPEVLAAGQWKNAIHSYLASVAFADHQVGRVLDQLDESPHGRNTIVVLMSDHGFLFGEKGSWRKQSLWDRVTHVPLIIVAPGTATPGTVCDAPVSLLDVFPTLTSLCDLPTPPGLSGRSLVPLLEDPSTTAPPVLTTRYRAQHGIHDGRYHFIQYPTGAQELYDLQADPHEWTNLVGTPEATPVIQTLSNWLPTVDVDGNP